MDALILFEYDVKKALLMKAFLVAVFFDIEKHMTLYGGRDC